MKLVSYTVMKVTVERCDYSIGARKSIRKLTKITETSSDNISVAGISVMLPLPDCQRNSPELEAHMLRTASIRHYNQYTMGLARTNL